LIKSARSDLVAFAVKPIQNALREGVALIAALASRFD
jgi:hypothetical protein